MTKNTTRDAHTNSIINNVLGIISVNDQYSGSDYYHVGKEYRQMKVFNFEPTEPIGSEIDIYVVDCYGKPVVERSEYESNRLTLEFKVIITRNPSYAITIPEY